MYLNIYYKDLKSYNLFKKRIKPENNRIFSNIINKVIFSNIIQ